MDVDRRRVTRTPLLHVHQCAFLLSFSEHCGCLAHNDASNNVEIKVQYLQYTIPCIRCLRFFQKCYAILITRLKYFLYEM